MRPLLPAFVLALLFIVHPAHAQWSPPMQLTYGEGDDRNPAFIKSRLIYSFPDDEWLAFSRGNVSGGRSIVLLHLVDSARVWSDSMIVVSTDTAENDFPAIARTEHNAQRRIMVVWQELLHDGESRLMYIQDSGNGKWSAPQIVLPGAADDRSPCLSPCDTSFHLVWVRNGVVVHSVFSTDGWAAPDTVSPPGDSVAGIPQVMHHCSGDITEVVWESLKLPDTTHAIFFSTRVAGMWSSRDTIAWTGDNRRPRFSNHGFDSRIYLSYESHQSGDWEILEAEGEFWNGSFSWFWKGFDVSLDPLADDREATLTSPICVTLGPCITLAAWRTSSSGTDSIEVVTSDQFHDTPTARRSAGPFAVNRNPNISLGTPSRKGMVFWVVWESNATGNWKLFGTSSDILLTSEGEPRPLPQGTTLNQNFPNPFNTDTQISYVISDRSFVELIVCDVLGRHVAQLVNELKPPGSYRVAWDASGVASGVYFYTLRTGKFIQTRRMILLK